MIEQLTLELGWKIEGSVGTEQEAMAVLATGTPTLALLDIRLGSTMSLNVAAACRRKGVPVVFTTGYSAQDIPFECGDAPILPKPFSPDEFGIALMRGLSRRTATPQANCVVEFVRHEKRPVQA